MKIQLGHETKIMMNNSNARSKVHLYFYNLYLNLNK